MSVIGEVVGIVACVAAVVSAYRDGGAIIQKIKVKRAARRAAAPPRLLEDSIDQAPEEIEIEKQRGIRRFGKAFEDGDHIAIMALMQITIQLQSSLLEKLRSDDETTDFLYLVDAADAGRDRTIGVLLELRQRLLAAKPIIEVQAPIFAEPRQLQPIPQVVEVPLRLAQRPSPSLGTIPQQRTLSIENSASRDASGEEDAASGADEGSQVRQRRRKSSIFDRFRHHRSHSGSKEDVPKPNRPIHSARSPTIPPPVPSSGIERASISAPRAVYQYKDGEDDPAQIWGAQSETASPAVTPLHDGDVSPSATQRSLSITSPYSPLPGAARFNSIAVPTPTPENQYLGFCKSAWKLQNGDRKGMHRCKELGDGYSRNGWAQPDVFYLACASSKCAFAGKHMNLDKIWTKVFVVEAKGLKFRWSFLAKSHVSQQRVKDQQYTYQCLFCVFLGEKSPVYFGTDLYLDHVSSHRGQALSEVVLYKAMGIMDRIAADDEDFDINLFPLGEQRTSRTQSMFLSDDLLGLPEVDKSSDGPKDSVHSNEPWNEGLSEFHWGAETERVEME
ncbi:hypothetical protein LTR27_004199 [Elasticomyces elasticus]|nr:hypothetical protein LTR27_004199 [Elasticomyces elasticus]